MADHSAQHETSSTEPDTRPAGKRRGPARFIKGAIIIALVVAGILWIGRWAYHQQTHVSSADARVVTDEVTVSSRLPGWVSDFSLIQGDWLEQGEVVARLYSKPEQLQLKKLETRVQRMQAQVAYERQRITLASNQLQGGIKQTKGELNTDLAAMEAAEAAMDKAEKTYKRSLRLFKSGTVSGQRKDEDYYTYLAAKANYERAKRQVAVDRSALANANIGLMSGPQMALPNPDILRAQLDVTLQELAVAKTDLKQQQVRLNDMTLRSPISGVVDKTFVEQGEYISPGQPVLMMHAPGNVWVEANIKENKVRELEPGQPVSIHVDAHPDIAYHGHVQVVGQSATSQFALLPNPNPSGNFTKITQRIPVRIAIDDGPEDTLSPGMMVVVDVDIRDDDA